LIDTLKALADEYQYPILVSTHPRTKKRLEDLGESLDHPLIRFEKPFGLLDYIKLQMNAFCVLSDSGTITEEASLLNLPAITIRNTHERPEGMDEGTLIMSGLKAERVLESVKVITSQHDTDKHVMPLVKDYQAGPVSKQVLRVVLSYTDYINRTVWHKDVK
jgi:UDP-N-acetylglucosamine 2-epimerase (non-hydrolysing)